MATEEPVIIRKRFKRSKSQAGTGGAWKIAYADFITAMMAFFLIMWLLAISTQAELEGVAEYFRTPLVAAVTGERISSSRSLIPGGDPSVIPMEESPNETDNWIEIERQDTLRLEDLRQRLEELIEKSPILQNYRPQLLLNMAQEGLMVQIVDDQNRPMFAMGSATLQSHMKDILKALAPTLNEMPYGITISGHTDAAQYATGDQFYSNWELSADRANAARQELVANGYDPNKVRRVVGLSSIINIDPDPMAAVNRRISIVVMTTRAERELLNFGRAETFTPEEILAPDDPKVIQIPYEPFQAVGEDGPLYFESLVPEGEEFVIPQPNAQSTEQDTDEQLLLEEEGRQPGNDGVEDTPSNTTDQENTDG